MTLNEGCSDAGTWMSSSRHLVDADVLVLVFDDLEKN